MTSNISTAEAASATRAELQRELALEKKNAAEGGEKKVIHMDEHLKTPAENAAKYNSNVTTGLTAAAVTAAQEKYGLNQLTPPKKRSLFLVFMDNMTGFFSLLLWGAAILCFIGYALDDKQQENLILGVVLCVVTFLTGCFSFYQDHSSMAAMEGFKNFLPPTAVVVRDGKEDEIEAKFLVPGDLVNVKNGNKVPADIIVLTASNFQVDNSSLTGESEPQKRKPDNTAELFTEATNVAFYGTNCVEGKCIGMVVRTGDNTYMGSIATMTTATDGKKTPIAIEIEHFIHIVSAVAVFLGVTFLIIGFAKGTKPIANLVFAIGIIVANVPEGLLATVTVALTLTATAMKDKKVLVKNLESVETLGSTTCIASDKTGTLTKNRMTAQHVYCNLHKFSAYHDTDNSIDLNDPTFQLLQKNVILSSAAQFMGVESNMAKEPFSRLVNGDASETAFIQFAANNLENRMEPKSDIDTVRANNKAIASIPFNSMNKYSASIHLQDNEWDKNRQLFMKGAPERIVNRCDFIMINGEKVAMTAEHIANFEEASKSMMQGGERVLGMAYCDLDKDTYHKDYEYAIDDPENYNFPNKKGDGLVFLGVISLMDPPRDAVPNAVRNCQTAGIKVIMVTGDHPETAEAIAKQVGIITGNTRRDVAKSRGVEIEDVANDDDAVNAIVIAGADLLEMDDEEIQGWLDYEEIVFARTSPEQKLIIVRNLQEKKFISRGYARPKPIKHVVAVTGDGVNDSPALRKADIGIAMGIAGSDVAKGAADMILLNDNFASIVDGIEEGRKIFDNLKKSIAYTLSSNIPEISPFLVFILAAVPLPLPTVLILCIDLGTDMVPAISLAYEQKEADIMMKPPRDSLTDRLVTGKLINFSYLQVGVVQATAGFYAWLTVLNDYGFPPWILIGLDPVWSAWGADEGPRTIKVTQGGKNYLVNYEFPDEFNSSQFGLTEKDQPTDWWFDKAANPVWENSAWFCAAGIAKGVEGIATNVACTMTELHNVCNIQQSDLASQSDCFNPKTALPYAQCAFFVSIIIVQWADLMACKTRSLSIKTQGMRNGTLNFGLLFETSLGAIMCYSHEFVNRALGTAKIEFVHWLPALPFMIFILSYDEVRKFLMRNLGKDNWFYRNTYY